MGNEVAAFRHRHDGWTSARARAEAELLKRLEAMAKWHRVRGEGETGASGQEAIAE